MSAIIVLAPAIIAGWPAISAAAAGAAAALGLAIAREAKELTKEVEAETTSVEVEVRNSEVLSTGLATGQEIVMTKENMRVRVYRDERGKCRVCVEGQGRSDEELRLFGEQVLQKMTQMFVYNSVMTELKKRRFNVVEERVEQDDSVRIHVRRQVD